MIDSLSIAERTFDLEMPTGKRVRFTASFGPIYQAGEDYRCPVRFFGWVDSPPDIHGIDSLQALLLAVNLSNSILKSLIERGGRVLYPDTDIDFPLETMIFSENLAINDPASS